MPPAHQSNAVLLGQLIEGVAGLRRDITDMRTDIDMVENRAQEGRRAVHSKIDGLTDRVAKVEGLIEVAGQITAQTRERIDEVNDAVGGRMDNFDATLATEVTPTVDEFKRMKMLGWSVVAVVGFGGTAFGATMIWWGEQLVGAIRGILRIH